MAATHHLGQRLSYELALCTVRYIGPVQGTQNKWLGVEWDNPARGKHDGEHNGAGQGLIVSGRSKSQTAASFVRPSRPSDLSHSFVEAVHSKYATEATERRDALVMEKEIEISGKKAQEIGFDKIRAVLAQLHELKIVIVDCLRISTAETTSKKIRDVCPRIIELDLTRNLFEGCEEIVQICRELDNLKSLRLNGNRFEIKAEELSNLPSREAFLGIQDLSLDEMLLSWDEVCILTQHFTSLVALSACSNELSIIPEMPLLSKMSGLKSLTLEYNKFSSLGDLAPLVELPSLETLQLKGNKIKAIHSKGENKSLVFGEKLYYIDLSYNEIASWSFVDCLPDVFPGLSWLRIAHNPVYENIGTESTTAVSMDETYMLTLARLAKLDSLNFSKITAAERTNAEMFYLSRISKAMAAVSEEQVESVTSQHRRYHELCELYGEPVVMRANSAINPNFLEARLINFTFYIPEKMLDGQESEIVHKRQLPRGFDIYQVKGVVGKMFGIKPLGHRLIWETGEWDPVAGYEEEEEEDYSDDEDEDSKESKVTVMSTNEKGKWMRREVELQDGTRLVGFYIDGMEAKVRIELR